MASHPNFMLNKLLRQALIIPILALLPLCDPYVWSIFIILVTLLLQSKTLMITLTAQTIVVKTTKKKKKIYYFILTYDLTPNHITSYN